MTTPVEHVTSSPSTHAVKTVAVVSRYSRPEMLDTVLDAGDYDVVFIESFDRAYSHIKRVTPDLVIVCLGLDDTEGFRVLSMLKLDSTTSEIPVVTYVAAPEAAAVGGASLEPDRGVRPQPMAVGMN